MTNRHLRNLIVWAVILAVAFPFALQWWRRTPRNVIDYSAFIELIQAEHVAQVEISDGTIFGRLKSGQQFTTYVLPGDTSYIELLKSKGAVIRVEPRSRGSQWPSLLTILLPILLLVALWVALRGKAQSGQDLASWLREKVAREQKVITPPTLPAPRGFSHGILVKGGQLLFLAGQDASDANGRIAARQDMVGQCEQVLRNLKAVVEAAGGGMQNITKLNIFVRDRDAYIAHLEPIGKVFRDHFGEYYPALALFQVSGFFQADALIEMEGFAVVEGPQSTSP